MRRQFLILAAGLLAVLPLFTVVEAALAGKLGLNSPTRRIGTRRRTL
jgi:hypothetical protein